MGSERERLNFDGFLEKLDGAISAARRTAHLAARAGNDEMVRSANETLRQLRAARLLVDGPMVWFKIEKGVTYMRNGSGKWRSRGIEAEPDGKGIR